MDTIKLKQISAVRKQSQLETDFESKYKDLYKSVEWIDPDWITYDYGQMALILATCIFDFRESKTSPYLHQTEGGCGGRPPWNNLDTAMAGFQNMSHGKATQSILWIMAESNSIQQGRLKPKDAQFINASHYVQRGSIALGKIKGLSKKLQHYTKEEKLELLEMVRDDNPIPNELKEKSIVVEPQDKLLGCAISELRKNGLVMTELDLQTEMAKRNKYSALLGDTNMGIIIKEQDDALQKSKSNGYRILASMGTSESVPYLDDFHGIAKEYYKLRGDISDITAFSYAGQIRIFKARDVLDYFESQSSSLRDEIASNLPVARNYRLGQKQGHEKEKIEYQIQWMESGEIKDLFEGEIPPNVGSDDARILRKISMQLPKLTRVTVFVIMTDDESMFKKIEIFLKKHPFGRALRVSKHEYIKACILNETRLRDEVKVYNFITNEEMQFQSLGARISKYSLNWRFKTPYQILWDFPNFNRSLEAIRLTKNGYKIPDGGYLKRRTVKQSSYWTQLPWEEFKKLPDFKPKYRHKKILFKRF
jgi:hypothetical protein